MATVRDEYNSLRQEMLSHQNNRLTVLSLALTASAALIAAGMELKNPLLLLVVPFLLLAARVQIVQLHAIIQRISSYIHIMLEDQSSELNWETASYEVRSTSIKKGTSVRNISSLKAIDNLLFITAIVSNVFAIYLDWLLPAAERLVPRIVTWAIPPLWLVVWVIYGNIRVREWNNMTADKREAEQWIEFREKQKQEKAQRARSIRKG